MESLTEKFAAAMDRIAADHNLVLREVAVAVSGGADSLALAFLLREYVQKHGGRAVMLTVNHHLRPEAAAEAEMVAALAAKWETEHHILDWFPDHASGSLEEKARLGRYRLLEEWCAAHEIEHLLIAHHQTDQAETFLMRLQRGSGVDGLASMQPFSRRGRINLIRPLLDIDPADLKDLLRDNQIGWAEDASNECDDFLRVRMRKFLPRLEKETGISVRRLAETAKALSEARAYFEDETDQFVNRYVRYFEQMSVSVSPTALNALHPELKRRVLARLLRQIGGGNYPPEYEELQRLLKTVADPHFRGCTLGGCVLVPFQKRLWIVGESKEKKTPDSLQWKDFVRRFPAYDKMVIPHALKCLLAARQK